jgi:hypothetical protein
MDFGLSEGLAALIEPQCLFPDPELLERINTALKEYDESDEVIVKPFVFVENVLEERPVFICRFQLSAKKRHDWIIQNIVGSHAVGPYSIQTGLEKTIIAVRNVQTKVFYYHWYFCLEEERTSEMEKAVRKLQRDIEQVKQSFASAYIIDPTKIPSAA